MLKLVKGLSYKKQYSHQAIDIIWEIYILRHCLMVVITSVVSAFFQVWNELISFQVKQGQFTVSLQNKCGPPNYQVQQELFSA